MKETRKQAWLCNNCFKVLYGKVSIDIPSADFVDPDGIYNCCNLYCPDCKETTPFINVDYNMGELMSLFNKNNFCTSYSCEGHVAELTSLQYIASEMHTDSILGINKTSYISILEKYLDLRRPYFIFTSTFTVLPNGVFSRKMTKDMFRISKETGWEEISFDYIGEPQGIKESQSGRIDKKLSLLSDKEFDNIIDDIYGNSHIDSLKITYDLTQSSNAYTNALLACSGSVLGDIRRIKKYMTEFFADKINILYNAMKEYFENEGPVELHKLEPLNL